MYKLPPPSKDCHTQAPQRMPLGVWESQIIFAKIFPKKHFQKKTIFFQKTKKTKNLIFSPSRLPGSKDATWDFQEKKSGNSLGGGEFAPEGVAKISFQF